MWYFFRKQMLFLESSCSLGLFSFLWEENIFVLICLVLVTYSKMLWLFHDRIVCCLYIKLLFLLLWRAPFPQEVACPPGLVCRTYLAAGSVLPWPQHVASGQLTARQTLGCGQWFLEPGKKKPPRENVRRVGKALYVVPVESWLKPKELSVTISCCLWGAGSLSQLREPGDRPAASRQIPTCLGGRRVRELDLGVLFCNWC